MQCKLNYQDQPKAFHINCTKVTLMQSYIKGVVLGWFELDLLLMEDPALCPLWINNFKEFVLEL